MGNREAALAIVGIYPPPYGGVSVGLLRLVPHLDAAGLEYVVYNTGRSKTEHPCIEDVGWSLRWTLFMLFRSRHQVIQFSTSRWWVRLFAALINLLRGTQVIVYARGYSLPKSFFQSGRLKRFLVRRSLRRFSRIFAPNPDLGAKIAEMGFPAHRIHVIPPFIPPVGSPQPEDVPPIVRNFCQDRSPVLVANGALVLIDGEDVYGLRAMVELVGTLADQYPQLGLVVYLRSGAEKHHRQFQPLLNRIRSSALSERILFYESTGDFYPVFSMADVFLRPTTTDGDANSIREALHFGIPVVASDVIPRPDGCREYAGRDDDALRTVTETVLANLADEKLRAAQLRVESAADRLLPIYQALLADQPAGHQGTPN